jgi:hypothetical protein
MGSTVGSERVFNFGVRKEVSSDICRGGGGGGTSGAVRCTEMRSALADIICGHELKVKLLDILYLCTNLRVSESLPPLMSTVPN